jgi:hypothetical protein
MQRFMVTRLVVLVVLALPALAWAQPAEREAPSDDAIDRAARRVLDGRYQGEPGEWNPESDKEALERWRRDMEEAQQRRSEDELERWKREMEQRERARREAVERGGDAAGDGERHHRRRGGRGGGGRPRPRGERTDEDLDIDTGGSSGGGAVGSIVAYLLYGALIVGVLFLILFIVREIMRRKGDADVHEEEAPEVKEEEAPADDAPKAELHVPLDEAELLAREGRFAEAIHLLLLRTFQELARAADVKIAASLTSREILARIPLRPGARDALAELVDVVENTWFGDDVPGEVQWQRCKAQFDRFVAIYRAPAPSLLEAA